MKCKVCGKEFEPEIVGSYSRTCSEECRKKINAKKIPYDIRICPVCGKAFKIIKSRRSRACSRECGNKLSAIERRKGEIERANDRAAAMKGEASIRKIIHCTGCVWWKKEPNIGYCCTYAIYNNDIVGIPHEQCYQNHGTKYQKSRKANHGKLDL